jgi:hypothetical protein
VRGVNALAFGQNMGHENVAVLRWRRLRLARGRRLTWAAIGVALALFVSLAPQAAVAAESSSASPAPDRLWESYSADGREGSGNAAAAAGGAAQDSGSGPGTLTFAAIALGVLALGAIIAVVALPRRRGARRQSAIPADTRGKAPKVARAAPIPAVRAPKPARPRRGTGEERRRRERPRDAEPDAPGTQASPAVGPSGPGTQPAPAAEPDGPATRPPAGEPATGPTRAGEPDGPATRPPAGEPRGPETQPSPAAPAPGEATRPSEPARREPGPLTPPIPAPAAEAPTQPPAGPAAPSEPGAPDAEPELPEPFVWPRTERRLRPRITPPTRPDTAPRARPQTERRLRPRFQPSAPDPAPPVEPAGEPEPSTPPVPRRRPLPATRAAERKALYEREFSRQIDTTQELRERITDLLAPGRDIQEATELLRTGRTPMVRPQREGVATPVHKPPRDEDRSCEIVVWRGRSRAQFHAVIPAAEGEGRWVGESPPFRWPRSRPMEAEGEALAAHTALVRALTRAGWEPDGQGDDWFSGTFRRVQAASAPERR